MRVDDVARPTFSARSLASDLPPAAPPGPPGGGDFIGDSDPGGGGGGGGGMGAMCDEWTLRGGLPLIATRKLKIVADCSRLLWNARRSAVNRRYG